MFPRKTAVSMFRPKPVGLVLSCRISRTMLISPGLMVRSTKSEVSERPPNATLAKLGLPSGLMLYTLPAFGPATVVSVFNDSAE